MVTSFHYCICMRLEEKTLAFASHSGGEHFHSQQQSNTESKEHQREKEIGHKIKCKLQAISDYLTLIYHTLIHADTQTHILYVDECIITYATPETKRTNLKEMRVLAFRQTGNRHSPFKIHTFLT